MVTTGVPCVLLSMTTRNQDEAWARRRDAKEEIEGKCNVILICCFDHFVFRYLERWGSFTALGQHLATVHIGHVWMAFAVSKIPLGYEIYELGTEVSAAVFTTASIQIMAIDFPSPVKPLSKLQRPLFNRGVKTTPTPNSA